MKDLSAVILSDFQKRAFFKLAVELVKADNRIHSKEINVLDSLNMQLGISQEEIDLIHYMTIQEAVTVFSELPENETESILRTLQNIMLADNDIDFGENILLTSVVMSIQKNSREWCRIISTPESDVEVMPHQIIYLEKEFSLETHRILDDRYDKLLIAKALNDIGFELFYLTDVISELSSDNKGSRFSLLAKSMDYLVPAGEKISQKDISELLQNLDTKTFCRVVMSRLRIEDEMVPFDSFLMIKIRDCFVHDESEGQRKYNDFLCIDISSEIKKRILDFVEFFNEKKNLISYEGYYKILYDYLSSESKTPSLVLVDSRYEFRLTDLENLKVNFESSPQARTLYLLTLRYGRYGIPQKTFGDAIDMLQEIDREKYTDSEGYFDTSRLLKDLMECGTDAAILICNTITIYKVISTKDCNSAQFLGYITNILVHRSSLKNYIATGFKSIDRLEHPDRYCLTYDKERKSYYIPASTSTFMAEDPYQGIIRLTDSDLWKSLK